MVIHRELIIPIIIIIIAHHIIVIKIQGYLVQDYYSYFHCYSVSVVEDLTLAVVEEITIVVVTLATAVIVANSGVNKLSNITKKSLTLHTMYGGLFFI
ncbi:hypothetical protein SDC9_67712 [bioreactor metagenome]|uniref:Uncharacterized protein n=1 Tax=bioreactor metagenome TaxID=1076179 RepID=A0A644XZR1_9ZZZZ